MSHYVSLLSTISINPGSTRFPDSPRKICPKTQVSRRSRNVNIRSQILTISPSPKSIDTSNVLAPENGAISRVKKSIAPVVTSPPESTLGSYLVRRLVQIGVTDVFCVPGDSNLTLLDYFVAEPGLNLIGCCNELNAGYAADGYARSRGVGVCVVTFTVGGLSILNAIAGAYSEDLPIICIVGGPNSNDYGTNKILHHTIGLPDFSQELKCFENITCFQGVVNSLEDAHENVNSAIRAVLEKQKPIYLNISCNLVSIPHPSFQCTSIPISIFPTLSNNLALDVAVEVAAEFLNKAMKPVLVGGPKMRASMASSAFVEFADKSGYPVALLPSAKGLFPEEHPNFIGTYWGSVSSTCCAEIVESADAYLFVGSVFDDFSSVGYSLLVKKQKAIIVGPNRVTLGNGQSFGCVSMNDFLRGLSNRIKCNSTALRNYQRIFVSVGKPLKLEQKVPLRVNILFRHVQNMLCCGNVVIAEAGDSWFNCQKLKLPTGCGYESQMLYASIGWSVGATLGYAQAAPDKRVITLIGDGSFQMTAQDMSTMLRCGHNSIIFLLNNGGYTTEVVIHDGPYNEIKNWDYTALIDAIDNREGKCWTTKVICEEELIKAIEIAKGAKKDCLCFIEVVLDKHDTSRELLEFGCRLAATNSRPPNDPSNSI